MNISKSLLQVMDDLQSQGKEYEIVRDKTDGRLIGVKYRNEKTRETKY